MKKNSLLMIAATILMTACGTMAQQSVTSTASRFEDGIYSSGPSFRSKVERQESKAGTDALVEKTKASRIYLFGEKKDTVMIPENMSASIWYDKEKGGTVVDVYDNPYDWRNNIDPWSYYTPYSIGSSWYWSRYYDPWYSSPYYWNSWAYSPHRYYGWYDPFYIGGWYDPWYYGYSGWYGGWYNPYYGYMYPHYCGWYGGWDPYWGYYPHHHHPIYIKDDNWHGSRHSTGSDRVFTSRVSTRGGIATASRTGRAAAVSTASRAQTSGNTAATRVSSRTSASRVSATTPTRVSSASNTGTIKRATTGAQQNYRRPAATASGHIVPTSGRVDGTTATYRPSGTESYRSSGSSYRSSSSSSSSRSSYSTSSPSRSSYSSGSSYSGGGSRSGGSSYSGGSSRSGGSSSGRR